jgi:hypothetical protein
MIFHRHGSLPRMKTGNRLRIESGPLTGTDGVLLRFLSEERVMLEARLLGHPVVLEVHVKDLAVSHAILTPK